VEDMMHFMKTEPNSDSLISELESLGIRASKLNELNDVYEVENLVEHLKQTFIQDYKSYCEYGINPISAG
jgi:hypothetical protein